MKKLQIMKRNGKLVDFDVKKIENAIKKANDEARPKDKLLLREIKEITERIKEKCEKRRNQINVEFVQDLVEDELLEASPQVAKKYIRYRENRAIKRRGNSIDGQIKTLVDGENEETGMENANKDDDLPSVQRDLIAGIVSKDISRRFLVPDNIMKAHDKGAIHMHDLDYFLHHIHNCSLVNIEDMLQNGTVISGVKIETPKSFQVACTIMTQIAQAVASSQYGGQSVSLAHLAPFVDVSRQKLRKKVAKEYEVLNKEYNEDEINKIAEIRLKDEIKDGVQTIQFQINTLFSTNGQTPFITIFMYLNEAKNQQEKDDLALIIEEVLKQRIQGLMNSDGVYITPAFPKLIYVLQEDNIHAGDKYWELTKLAAQCTAKRMVPDYISEKIMKQLKVDSNGEGHCYTAMGCRSFLTPYVDKNGKPKYNGRFNQGVTTINLPYVALESEGDIDKFWELLDNYLELVHQSLMLRHSRLKGVKAKHAPILWQHGGLARLDPEDTIDELLYGGYSTISLGFAGLYEATKFLTGYSHTDPAGRDMALAIMNKLNDSAAEWKAEHNIDFSVYGTPLESTTDKFARATQNAFGVHEGINDKPYVTNSYHVHVTEEIDAFSKLAFESEFQALSPGGAISYVEAPNLSNNIDAVLSIMQFIYDNIMYAEINIKSDYCSECGFDGEILSHEVGGKYIWKCPNCGCEEQDKLYVARRVCGYIGVNKYNYGRTGEIHDRVLHVSLDTENVPESDSPSLEGIENFKKTLNTKKSA